MTYEIGQSAVDTRIVEQADIEAFARVSGDVNPLHVNAAMPRAPVQGRHRPRHGPRR